MASGPGIVFGAEDFFLNRTGKCHSEVRGGVWLGRYWPECSPGRTLQMGVAC